MLDGRANFFHFEVIMNLVVRDFPVGREIASSEFRNAMRHLTGGISVITAGVATIFRA